MFALELDFVATHPKTTIKRFQLNRDILKMMGNNHPVLNVHFIFGVLVKNSLVPTNSNDIDMLGSQTL